MYPPRTHVPEQTSQDNLVSAKDEFLGFKIIKMFSQMNIPCIAFSSYDLGGFIEHAISAEIGAKAFVSKNSDETILLAALNTVKNGGTYIQSELVTRLLDVINIKQTFTKKEKLIAEAITQHETNAEIAEKCGISEKTLLNYLSILYDKTGVNNKTELLKKLGKL